MLLITDVTESGSSLLITVTEQPSFIARLFRIKPKTTVYRGHDMLWYHDKTGRRALKEVAVLLHSTYRTLRS